MDEGHDDEHAKGGEEKSNPEIHERFDHERPSMDLKPTQAAIRGRLAKLHLTRLARPG
jgi:hypothetical protein